MPSSHAQFVSYFGVSLVLFLLVRHRPHPTRTRTPLPLRDRSLVAFLAALCSAAAAASRVYLNYHTSKQVLIGSSVGAAIAVGWFIATEYLRRSGWLSWALELELARYFRIRDLVVTEDLPDSGWTKWEEMRSKRRSTSSARKRK